MASTATYSQPAAYATEVARAEFIRRTYTHLALAILGFILVENLLLQSYIRTFR